MSDISVAHDATQHSMQSGKIFTVSIRASSGDTVELKLVNDEGATLTIDAAWVVFDGLVTYLAVAASNGVAVTVDDVYCHIFLKDDGNPGSQFGCGCSPPGYIVVAVVKSEDGFDNRGWGGDLRAAQLARAVSDAIKAEPVYRRLR